MARPVAPPSAASRLANPYRTVALLLLTVATVISTWLAIQSLRQGSVAGCDGGDCAVVLSSRWSKLFSVPVGLFGAAAYGILAVLGAKPLPKSQARPRIAACALALLIPAAALWFVALQLLVLRAFCPWCTATHIVATLGAGLLVVAWRRDEADTSVTVRKAVKGSSVTRIWRPAAACAAVALGGFIMAQILGPAPASPHLVKASMDSSPVDSAPRVKPPDSSIQPFKSANSAVSTGAATGAISNVSAVPRLLTLHDGRFRLDPHQFPIFGSQDAEHFMVMISDYTCHYCRAAHRTLHDARDAFGSNQLAVVMLPTQHGGDSLEIQQLMLATWKADPEVWSSVADDLYSERIGLNPASLRDLLSRRLGQGRLEASLLSNADWTTNVLNLTKEISAANRAITKKGNIPQFIIGKEIVVGAPEDTTEFFDLFASQLGLVRDRLPDLQLATAEIELGRSFAGTHKPVAIAYANRGNAALQITRAGLPPGGRTTRGLQVPLSPGQTSTVEFSVAIPTDEGPFQQTLTLYSNARTSTIPVRITGTSWKPLTITPSVLDFGHLDADNASTQGVLRLEFSEPAAVDFLRSQSPGFSASLREITPRRAYDVVVGTTPRLGIGLQQTTLMVSLRKPVPAGWPETLMLAARATVERAVTAIPPRLILPAGELPNDRYQQVLVRCGDGTRDFAVRSAVLEGGPAFLRPTMQRGSRTNEFIVQLTLPAGWSVPMPPESARLIIETSHPRYSTIEVPLVAQGQ